MTATLPLLQPGSEGTSAEMAVIFLLVFLLLELEITHFHASGQKSRTIFWGAIVPVGCIFTAIMIFRLVAILN